MKAIYGFNQIGKIKKAVVALGVFDGVHRGHRNILDSVVTTARRIRGKSIVLTFWPHPQKEESLYSLEHRLKLIDQIGVDLCIVVNFDRKFALISALDFVRDILFKKLHVRYLYVGKNFRFGKNKEGNFETLNKLSRLFNFKLKLFKVVKIGNKTISSTYIRSLIRRGDLSAARKLLGRPVSILGTVIRGGSVATRLGFPTANIDPHHEVIPPAGVYAARVIFNNKKLKGICYIGSRPTFKHQTPNTKHQTPRHIEVHIFNFKQNIYSKYLEIQFVKKIREENKFYSSRALARQIKKDILAAMKISPTTTISA